MTLQINLNFLLTWFLIPLIKILIIIVPLLISVAYFTLAERKIRDPKQFIFNLSDGFKLLVKETVLPSSANRLIFIISPMLTFVISLMGWAVIPYDKYSILAEMNIGFLYLFAMSSLGVYGIIMSGWSSNSKYAFLGALRSTAQMVSYEVSIGFIMITIVVCCGSFNLQQIIETQRNIWFVIPFFPLFLIFFTSALAETNRHPFDLPEAEAELVSGYNVEYSAYANMLMMSSINVVLFFGGWLAPMAFLNFLPGSFWFGIKICFFVFLFIWMRAALPRYRYDQLMGLGWKVFLPVSLSYLMLTYSVLINFNLLPY